MPRRNACSRLRTTMPGSGNADGNRDGNILHRLLRVRGAAKTTKNDLMSGRVEEYRVLKPLDNVHSSVC